MTIEQLYKYYTEYFTKADLYEFLDTYNFVDNSEIYLAVCEFMESKIEGLDWWGLADATSFADDYIKSRLIRDTKWIIEEYENRIEQFADYMAETY